jgi:hypothetical protein
MCQTRAYMKLHYVVVLIRTFIESLLILSFKPTRLCCELAIDPKHCTLSLEHLFNKCHTNYFILHLSHAYHIGLHCVSNIPINTVLLRFSDFPQAPTIYLTLYISPFFNRQWLLDRHHEPWLTMKSLWIMNNDEQISVKWWIVSFSAHRNSAWILYCVVIV